MFFLTLENYLIHLCFEVEQERAEVLLHGGNGVLKNDIFEIVCIWYLGIGLCLQSKIALSTWRT